MNKRKKLRGPIFKFFVPAPLAFLLTTGYLVSGAHAGIISDDDQLWLPASGNFRPERIKILGVSDGAPPLVFDKPLCFPKLDDAALHSSKNRSYLKALSENYPRIAGLSIKQLDPLSEEDILRLRQFGKLKRLFLDCPVSDPVLLAKNTPSTVRLLTFGPYNNIAKSEHLEVLKLDQITELKVCGTPISRSLISALRAKNLRRIVLLKASPEGSIFQNTTNIPSLKTVDFENTPASEQDREQLRHCKIRVRERKW